MTRWEIILDCLAWIALYIWFTCIPTELFSLETHPITATICAGLLFYRCMPYLIQLDEYD